MLSDSFFRLNHGSNGLVSIELNDDLFQDHTAEEIEEFHRDFVSKLHGFLQEEGEQGMLKLSQYPPPTLSDFQTKNFTLQGFYERWNQDLDSVDLTTDGVNTQIQKRLSKEQSADQQDALSDDAAMDNLQVIRDELNELLSGESKKGHASLENRTIQTDTDTPFTDVADTDVPDDQAPSDQKR